MTISSLTERMSVLPSIEIDSKGEFVVKITHNGHEVAQVLIAITDIRIEISSGRSDVVMTAMNPNHILK